MMHAQQGMQTEQFVSWTRHENVWVGSGIRCFDQVGNQLDCDTMGNYEMGLSIRCFDQLDNQLDCDTHTMHATNSPRQTTVCKVIQINLSPEETGANRCINKEHHDNESSWDTVSEEKRLRP